MRTTGRSQLFAPALQSATSQVKPRTPLQNEDDRALFAAQGMKTASHLRVSAVT